MERSYLYVPYVPNRGNKKKKGRPTPYPYLHRIAYSEDLRGEKDNIPTLLFYGAPFDLLRDVCLNVFNMMNGKVEDLVIDREHSCRWRNGKCYWRTMIQIHGLDENFISLKDFTLLLITRMQDVCNCSIRHYKLETFVNL